MKRRKSRLLVEGELLEYEKMRADNMKEKLQREESSDLPESPEWPESSESPESPESSDSPESPDSPYSSESPFPMFLNFYKKRSYREVV